MSPRGKGALINRGANEQQGEEAQRGGEGGSIEPWNQQLKKKSETGIDLRETAAAGD